MLKADADRWIAALRSGQYQKGRRALSVEKSTGVEHCCLGVACVLENIPFFVKPDGYRHYGKDDTHTGHWEDLLDVRRSDGKLPLGLRTKTGDFNDTLGLFSGIEGIGTMCLAALNDTTDGFDKVILAIENYWEQL